MVLRVPKFGADPSCFSLQSPSASTTCHPQSGAPGPSTKGGWQLPGYWTRPFSPIMIPSSSFTGGPPPPLPPANAYCMRRNSPQPDPRALTRAHPDSPPGESEFPGGRPPHSSLCHQTHPPFLQITSLSSGAFLGDHLLTIQLKGASTKSSATSAPHQPIYLPHCNVLKYFVQLCPYLFPVSLPLPPRSSGGRRSASDFLTVFSRAWHTVGAPWILAE